MPTPIEINLTTASPDSAAIQLDENNLNYREFIIKDFSGTPWGAGATVYIERKLSDVIGFIKILTSPSGSQYSITSDGAGLELESLVRNGQLKFVLVGGDGSTNIKITIA